MLTKKEREGRDLEREEIYAAVNLRDPHAPKVLRSGLYGIETWNRFPVVWEPSRTSRRPFVADLPGTTCILGVDPRDAEQVPHGDMTADDAYEIARSVADDHGTELRVLEHNGRHVHVTFSRYPGEE